MPPGCIAIVVIRGNRSKNKNGGGTHVAAVLPKLR